MILLTTPLLLLFTIFFAINAAAHPLLDSLAAQYEKPGTQLASTAVPALHVDQNYLAPSSEVKIEGKAWIHANINNGSGIKSDGNTRKYPVPKEAIAAWENDRVCAPMDYWRATPENMEESEAQEFILKWIDAHGRGEDGHTCSAEFTAIQCFAKVWAGDFNFQCSIDHMEKCKIPTAYDIVKWIRSQHHDWPTDRLLDTARKVFFAFRNLEVVLGDMNTDWESLRDAKGVIATEAHRILGSFTQGTSETQKARCEVAKITAQLVTDVALTAGVVGVNTGQFVGPMAEVSKSAAMIAQAAKHAGDNPKLDQLALKALIQDNLLKNTANYMQMGTGLYRKGSQASETLRNAQYHDKGASEPGRQGQLGHIIIKGHGLCGNVYGILDDNSASQTDDLIKFIHEAMDAVINVAEQLFNSIFVKNDEVLGDLTLNAIMGFGSWTGRTSKTYTDQFRKIKTAIRAEIISELLAASRQYLKCEERDDAQEICKRDQNSPSDNRISLFCPEAFPRLRCQAVYRTKKQLFNHEKDLPGLQNKNSFEDYGIIVEDLVENSIRRHYMIGIDSYSPGDLYVEGKVVHLSNAGYLPVAISKVKTVHPGSHGSHFPFSCGNWASNCTSAFMARVNVDIHQEWQLRYGELSAHLALIPEPANRFFLLCNLGVRWPSAHRIIGLDSVDPSRLDKSGPSMICGQLKKEIGDKDELEGNYRFCKTIEFVQEHVFKQEREMIGKQHSHKKLCDKWLAENSIEIQRRFG